MERLAIAPCGIDCDECNLYRAGFEPSSAEALVDWFRGLGWIGLEEGADAVQAKAPFCMGCRGDQAKQWSGDCAIRACAVDERELSHCGQCGDFLCPSLKEFAASAEHHAAAVERLKRLRDNA